MPARNPSPSSPSSRDPRRPRPEAAPPARAAVLALCAAALLPLSGCQDDPAAFADDESPDHMIEAPKSQGKYRFGVTDTLAIAFSEPIDTAALDIGFSDSEPIGVAFRGRSRVLLFGTQESFGARHFRINTSFTLTMTGLRDDAGNGHPAITETFQPYRWADRDVLDRNFRGYDSLFSGDTAWIDGTPLADSLIVEGALDFNENTGDEDRVDLKIVRLAPPDTLEVLVTAARPDLPVRLQVGGPFAPENLDSAVTRAENFFPRPGLATDQDGRVDTAFHADFQKHRDELGSADAAGLYVLRLSLPEADTEGFYRIQLKIRKYRRR